MRDRFISRLSDLVKVDSRVILVTGDLGFGVFDEFRNNFPGNFVNAGVAEQNMTSLATGMAMEGRIVYTYSIANFSTLRCLEQIRNDCAYHGANVNVVAVGGGFSYGALGISHHATEDLAIMRSLPDVCVVAPTGLWETGEATEAVCRQRGTCYLRLDKSHGSDGQVGLTPFQLGKGRVVREGQDCAIIVIGGILEEAENAAKKLEKHGASCRIISLHSLKPIDCDLIVATVKEVPVVVTLEEHTIDGGLGSAVSEVLMDAGVYPKRFKRIGLRNGFSSIVGSQEYLREVFGLDAEAIFREIVKLYDD